MIGAASLFAVLPVLLPAAGVAVCLALPAPTARSSVPAFAAALAVVASVIAGCLGAAPTAVAGMGVNSLILLAVALHALGAGSRSVRRDGQWVEVWSLVMLASANLAWLAPSLILSAAAAGLSVLAGLCLVASDRAGSMAAAAALASAAIGTGLVVVGALLLTTKLPGASAAAVARLALTGFATLLAGVAALAGVAPMHAWLADALRAAPGRPAALVAGIATAAPLAPFLAGWEVFIRSAGLESGQRLVLPCSLAVLAAALLLAGLSAHTSQILASACTGQFGLVLYALGVASPGTTGIVLFTGSHAIGRALFALLTMSDRQRSPEAQAAPASTVAALWVAVLAISVMPPTSPFRSLVTIVRHGLRQGSASTAALALTLSALTGLALIAAVRRAAPDPAFGAISRSQRLTVACLAALLVGLGLVPSASLEAFLTADAPVHAGSALPVAP